MGISIYSGQNIAVDGVTSKDMWGDGFYVDQVGASPKSTGITFCNVVADNNRRQGMSIVWVDGMTVRDSVFKNTNGTPPAAGIGIEPDAGKGTNNVTITGSQFLDNVGGGVSAYGYNGNTGYHPINNTTISNNYIRQVDVGIWLQGIRSGATVTGNVIEPGRNASHGIYLNETLNSTIANNRITNPGWDGIRIETDSNSNTVSGNYVEGSSQGYEATWSNISLNAQTNANIVKCNTLRVGVLKKPAFAINLQTSGVRNTQLLTNDAGSGYYLGVINNKGTGTLIHQIQQTAHRKQTWRYP